LIVLALQAAGRIRWIRVWASPLAGAAVVLGAGIGVGSTLGGLVLGALACVATILLIERSFFPGDLAFMTNAARGFFSAQRRGVASLEQSV
jgi:hypothetical protein